LKIISGCPAQLPAARLTREIPRGILECRFHAADSQCRIEVDDQTRQLQYVNAGHNPPYVLRSHGQIEELDTGGTVIGLFPDMSYEEASIELRSGDVLLAFTDGVTEALNPEGEQFGEERLKNLLRRVASLDVDEMSCQVLHELKNWIQHATQHDDLTYLIMKVN
jgi:phosphoserine phosphatase RsbU/P